jgi:hypothetical protein
MRDLLKIVAMVLLIRGMRIVMLVVAQWMLPQGAEPSAVLFLAWMLTLAFCLLLSQIF